jgi:hypothetical protein
MKRLARSAHRCSLRRNIQPTYIIYIYIYIYIYILNIGGGQEESEVLVRYPVSKPCLP